MVLHSPAGPGPGVAGSAGSQAGVSVLGAYCNVEVPGACDVQQDGVLLWEEPQA